MLYINAETFDFRLRATSKFLLFQLLHVNCDVSAYQSTGQCLYISVLNLISQDHFWICIYTLFISMKQKLLTILKKYIVY